MASPLSCDGSCRAAADPRCGVGGGGSSSSNKRRRRCFSSVPLQPAALPPSPFSAPAPVADGIGEAASTSCSQVGASRCAARASRAWPLASLAAGMRAAAEGAVRARACPIENNGEEDGEGRFHPPSTRRRRQPQDQRAGASTASRTRGLLSRAATAAATAAVVAVSASAPVGVGALTTEEQCKDATLRGTDTGLAASRRPDTVTEAAAAGIDRTIVASQATYDRMVADQASITREEGVDVPFRNLWSDLEWSGSARVTFADVETLGLFEEGSPPEFNCMNEYYGLSFERGDAVATPVFGTLKAEKVLNWDVLSPDYLALEGLESFVPTGELAVPATTFLVAAREEAITEDFSAEFSEEGNPGFHYFLSLPPEDVQPSACPEPCTGEVVSYYWSQSAGKVYLLDRVSAIAETQPCWLELFQTVAGGPPAGGVQNALWEATGACTEGLLQGVEDAIKSGEYSSASAAVGDGSDGDGGGGGTAAVAAAVLIPALLLSFAVVAFGLLRYQKAQRVKKMKTTEEAWGAGLDGAGGAKKLRPPTGRFKLGVAGAAVAAEGAGVAGGIARLKSFPPPERVFTDVSIDDEDGGVAMTAVAATVTAAGEGRGDEEEGRLPEDDEEGEDVDGGNMIYPM
eukprot:g18211.t1